MRCPGSVTRTPRRSSKDGPYKAKSDLKARKIVSESEYKKIEKLIVAKQASK